jgi:energy-coupling factor transport system permease protein
MTEQTNSRVDPVNGVIWLILFNLTALQETRTQIQLVYSAEVILFSILVFRVSASALVRVSRKIIFLPSMLLIFHLFAHSGNVLINFGLIQITHEGASFGVLYFFRFFNAVLAAIAFALSIRTEDLMASLARIGLPDRAALSIYLTLRYIPLMTREGSIVWAAVRIRRALRGHDGPLEQARIFGQYAATLVLRAVERAETTAVALQYRQFGATRRRTYISAARWQPKHLYFLLPHVIIVAWALGGGL